MPAPRRGGGIDGMDSELVGNPGESFNSRIHAKYGSDSNRWRPKGNNILNKLSGSGRTSSKRPISQALAP